MSLDERGWGLTIVLVTGCSTGNIVNKSIVTTHGVGWVPDLLE